MGFGFLVRNDSNGISASGDHPVFKYVGAYGVYSRSGNTSIYRVPTTVAPLCFLQLNVGQSGNILSIINQGAYWEVTALTSSEVLLRVFVPLSGTPSGWGLAVWDAYGRLVFDAGQNPLNAEKVALFNVGSTLAAAGDLVSFTGGHVYPQSSYHDDWVYLDTYAYQESRQVYVCRDYQEQVYVCNYVYEWQNVCTDSYQCSMDAFGNYSCGYVTTCSMQQVGVQRCGYEWQTVNRCGYETVWDTVIVDVFAQVRTTNWWVYRGVAQRTSDGYNFNWLLHASGYYKTTLQTAYQSSTTSGSPLYGGTTPYGGNPPGFNYAAYQGGVETYEGSYTKNNTFPYATQQYNMADSAILTARSSDYA